MKIIIIVFLLCASSILSRSHLKTKKALIGECKTRCEGWLTKPEPCNKVFTEEMWNRIPAYNKMADPTQVKGRLFNSKSGKICVCEDDTTTPNKPKALLLLTIENDHVSFDGVEVCKKKDQIIYNKEYKRHFIDLV